MAVTALSGQRWQGVIGSSALFDGTDNAQVTSPLVTGTGNFTISCWIYPTSNPANTHFVTTYNSGTTDWALRTDSGIVKWYTEGVATDSSGVTLTINTWHHVAVKRTGTTISFVIDGTVSGNTFTRSEDYNAGGSGTFSIGGSVGAGGENFVGYISDVAVWNTAVDDSDLQAIYNDKTFADGTDNSDLVAYYPLNVDYTDSVASANLTTSGDTTITSGIGWLDDKSTVTDVPVGSEFEQTDDYKSYQFSTTGTDCTGLTGGTSNTTSDYIRATKLTASASVTITTIRATLSSVTGNVKFAIYSDDSDSPDALLATTGSKTAVNGESDYALSSSYAITSGTDYWVSIQCSTDAVHIVSGSGGARANAYAGSTAFATDPDPYPSHLDDTTGFQFCIYPVPKWVERGTAI